LNFPVFRRIPGGGFRAGCNDSGKDDTITPVARKAIQQKEKNQMGLFSTRIPAKKMAPVCRQLAASYDSGIPITASLELIRNGARDPALRRVFTRMGEDIQQGATLGEAAEKQESRLPRFFVRLISSGEISGRLDVMLTDLADYFEERVAMQRAVMGALAYPLLQLAVAWFLGSFALGLAGSIDFSGRRQFRFEDYMMQWAFFQAAALVIFGVVLVVLILLSRSGVLSGLWGWCGNAIWPFKKIYRKFALARFFRSLSLLTASGLDLRRGIRASAETIENRKIRDDLMKAIPFISEGATLEAAFAGSRTLTPVARQMLKVGEESGRIDETLRKVSEYHFSEARQALNIGAKILSVLILLATGLVVGLILFSFYGRLYGGMLREIG
jgi:type II secretory pathway component PulF